MARMKSPVRQIRSPVRREGASRYLLLVLISFAASVTLTRLFLQLTGYPRIGAGSLHIAHVLWGGLLLFVAALLPLLLANRWASTASALLAGAGTGLFIDEVGKFITSTNNYFYPPAAPIIYVFFLLTVWIYFQIRKSPSQDPRAAFYRVLDGLEEVLDRDLEPAEQAELVRRLQSIEREAEDPDLARLARRAGTLSGKQADYDCPCPSAAAGARPLRACAVGNPPDGPQPAADRAGRRAGGARVDPGGRLAAADPRDPRSGQTGCDPGRLGFRQPRLKPGGAGLVFRAAAPRGVGRRNPPPRRRDADPAQGQAGASGLRRSG